jgi:hypothetical protein
VFVRVKKSGPYQYLQIVESVREGARVRQRVIGTIGRVDQAKGSKKVAGLIRSLGKFTPEVRILEAHRNGDLEAGSVLSLGPDLVFGRLWRDLGIGDVLEGLLRDRRFEFAVERAVYLTVLHRLFESGSDRAAERWRRDVVLPGCEDLELHHLYRAMRWLGDVKDQVEEALFLRCRDLFTDLTLAFFDTTSLAFEGQGGESLGQYGFSRDHRPDLRQMVVGAVLTGEGRPVCSELWPGNTSDTKAFLAVVDRLRERFGIRQVCWVADRGMINAKTIEALESRGLQYIFGARMRKQREVRVNVLGRGGGFQTVSEKLRVKEVVVEGRRYVVCHNPIEEAKDASDREAILAGLRDQLRHGARRLVGNRGFRRYVRIEKDAVHIDAKKVREEARYDGKWVLRTNTDLPTAEVAVQYKRLLMVESFFRGTKAVLETRPIYHQWDATIQGHVFCSFLAVVLLDELKRRLAAKGEALEWGDIRRDLANLSEVEVRDGERWYRLRTALKGVSGQVLKAIGVRPPPALRTA